MKHRLFPYLLMPIILSLLLPAQAQPTGPGPYQSIAPEPYPFSDRYPAEVILTTPEQMDLLLRAEIDIGSVHPLFPGRPFPRPGQPFEPLRAEIYVNEGEAAGLESLGLTVTPIPNETLRAHRAYPQGSDAPEAWPTYAQFVARMQTIASNYPSIVRMVSIGQSVQGREIWMLKITDNPDVEEDEPEFKYTSSMHGDETVGIEMTLRLAELLTQNYGSDPALTELVNEIEIWLLPIHNPDGYVNNSRYNAHGVDLNRNFPDRITDPHDDPAGREPETQALMYFGYDHRFTMGANYHGGAAVVNFPWDSVPNPPDYAPDDALYYEYSVGYAVRNSRIWNGGFPNGVTRGWEWYIVRGGMQDWAYHWQGEHHVTIELGNTKKPPYEQMDIYWNENREAMLWWMRRALEGVRGRVYDAVSGAPLDATVNVLPIDKAVRTDPDVGDYHRLLLPGTYTLVCHAEGYLDQSWPITVVSGTATVQDCAMRREADYAVAVGNSSAAGAPGQAVTHTLAITNTGTRADIYTIALSSGDWPATLLTPQVGPLQPQQAGQALVQVHIPLLPLTATVLLSDVLALQATSQADPTVSAQGRATTYAVADLAVEMSVDLHSQGGLAGQVLTYTLQITNIGAYTDTYTLTLLDNAWPAAVWPTHTGLLPPGAQATAWIQLTIPVGPAGETDAFFVRATSGWSPLVHAEQHLLARRNWAIYLPIVNRQQAWRR